MVWRGSTLAMAMVMAVTFLGSWTATGEPVANIGEVCSTLTSAGCGEGAWCDPKPGSCGQGPAVGSCVRTTRACPRHLRYVCGCDGRSYGNDCLRKAAKTGLAHEGKCLDDLKP